MINYKLKYFNPHQHFLYVEVTINVKEKDSMDLQFPMWRPGRYELGNFPKNINAFKVLDEKGKKVTWEKTAIGSWVVHCKGVDQINVKYRYYAYELNAGSTFIDVGHFYINPINCCIYIKGEEEVSCVVTLDIPEAFTVASAQSFDHQGMATFNSYHDLVDTPIIASESLQHNSYESYGVKFHIWFNGEVQPDWNRIITDFQKFTDSQMEHFKEFPVQEYHYMYQIAPYALYHGVEHQHCTVCALGPSTKVMNSFYDEFLGVSSHELYHTWNVKAIRPIEMFPYDYSKENYSHLGYIAEGVTTYMGDLFLWKSKVFDDQKFYKLFEGQINKHFANMGRFNYSVAESSKDTWLDGYEKGIPERKVSIYTEGCLISFMIDSLIMRATDNKKSIHDVMRNLYFNYALKNKGVSKTDYQKEIESVAGESFDNFFAEYVYGTSSYESLLYDCLEYVGLELQMQPASSKAASFLGILTVQKNGKTIISDVYPGSTADLMGLSRDDEIIAVNNYKINTDLDEWITYFEEEPMELYYFRNNVLKSAQVLNTNKNYYVKYSLEPIKNASKVQQNAFKKWSGK